MLCKAFRPINKLVYTKVSCQLLWLTLLRLELCLRIEARPDPQTAEHCGHEHPRLQDCNVQSTAALGALRK